MVHMLLVSAATNPHIVKTGAVVLGSAAVLGSAYAFHIYKSEKKYRI